MDREILIKKWLNNELNDRESEAFNNLEDSKLLKEIVEEVQRFSGTENTKVESFDLLDKKLISSKKSSIGWMKLVSSIAAIFVVGIGVFTFLNRDQINSYNTEIAQIQSITLPDNSIVKLNELSSLDYDASNWDENRYLNLSGEAFFDVEKGKRFDVNTDYGKVSVLGTEFNVHSRDSLFSVSCYEGLVQVTYNGNTVKLPAGTEFKLSSKHGGKTDIVISEPYWLKQMSVFENTSFVAVIEELQKQYHIDVQYPPNLNISFTGAFEHNNLENALKSVCQPLNLTYEIQNNNKVIIRNGEN